MRTFLLIFLGGLLLTVSLQAQTHDLELRIDVDAPGVTPPGSSGILTFTVTNHGPDPAGVTGPFGVRVTGTLLVYSHLHGLLVDFYSLPGIPSCQMTSDLGDPLPEEHIPVTFMVLFETLAPGESVSCGVGFVINSLAYQIDPTGTMDGNIVHRWTAGSATGTDPDPSNDTVLVTHQLVPPSTIPTLSPWGLAVLSLGLVAAYAFVRQRA